MAGGFYNPGMLNDPRFNPFAAQSPMAPAASSAPPPSNNSPAGLSARYGTAPETVDQWRTMNGFGAPQPNAPQEIPGNPITPTGPPPGGSGPTSGGGAPSGNPTDYAGYLQSLMGKVGSYDPTAGINDAFKQMREYVGQQTVGDATAQMGARGLLPSDNTSQDLKAVLMGRAMNPIAVQHAQALSNAQQQGLNNQMSLAGMLGDAQRQTQQQQWQQQQFEYQKTQDAANRAFQQAQADWQRQQQGQQNQFQQSQFDWQKQQANNANVHGGVVDAAGNPIAPSENPMAAGGGVVDDPAARARALIMAGSGGRSLADILGGGGGSGPMTPTGQPAGGGVGLAGGAAQGGSGFGEAFGGFKGGHVWDGIDRSVGYNNNQPKPFEGANTTTVGSSLNGSTTTGSGTSVGGGSPFSSAGGAGRSAAGSLSSSLSGSGGTMAATPFPGVQGSGTYTTVGPKPPAPAPRRLT